MLKGRQRCERARQVDLLVALERGVELFAQQLGVLAPPADLAVDQ